MSGSAKWRWCSNALYVLVAAVFGVAAVLKLIDPEAFLSSLLTYELFPFKVAGALALFAPILEALVAFGLLTGFFRKGASLLAGVSLVVFIVLVGQGLVRGLELDCGCFGENRLETSWDYAWKMGQNALLLVALMMAICAERRSKTGAKDA